MKLKLPKIALFRYNEDIMLFMQNSKNKIFLATSTVVLLVAGLVILYTWQKDSAVPLQSSSDQVVVENATNALKGVVELANQLSGVDSIFAYEVTDEDGRFANFGIVRYHDDVRADSVVEEHAVTFQETGDGATGHAEVDRNTNQVVSMHRKSLNSGKELPAGDIEKIARQFLERAYPDFKAIEPTLTFNPGMKGSRLNNGNYFFRWNDLAYKQTLPDGVNVELDPFVQVGITASGFIFSYENTIPLYRSQSF